MTDPLTRCYILPLSRPGTATETPRDQLPVSLPPATIAERLASGAEVAPGVTVALVSLGHDGAVIAVQRRRPWWRWRPTRKKERLT